MDLKITISVAVVIAIAAAELLSVLIYSEQTPWGRWSIHRYWVAAVISDIGLAFMLQWIIRDFWTVYKWEEAAKLAMWVALLYASLEAPHTVYDQHSFTRFFYNVAHKGAVVFVMTMCLIHFKDY